jgi:hypothetical protein
MSAIGSVGNSPPVSSQPIQPLPTKQTPKATAPVSSPAGHSAGKNSHHHGDCGGGIDKMA